MKFVKTTAFTLLVIIVVAALAVTLYLQTTKPQYKGTIVLEGLREDVEVFFDDYGIPHIYGGHEEDVYLALGYLHAQERLFQMEMMRRTAAGRLAEILGRDLLETDRFFRTLGLNQIARRSSQAFISPGSEPYQRAALAYLRGVNHFIDHGGTPIEFRILGIPKNEFSPEDIYLIGSLLAFGFAEGFQMDPLITGIHAKLGMEYLGDWVLDWAPGADIIPVPRTGNADAADRLGGLMRRVVASLPMAPWIGSNGWVLSPALAESGHVLFANDTHMTYSQPSVWYEAHLECPGFGFYGNHAAGIPFALIGHSRNGAWGLTMFENDDVDFYREKLNPADPNQVWVDDHWENLAVRNETIAVKGEADVLLKVRSSRHGPVISDVSEEVASVSSDPVSVWWAADKFPLRTVHAFYMLAHARSLEDARNGAALIDAPGLNVMYGDREGNIAWWAAARLVIRPAHPNPKLFRDGASGRDEPVGWYDFSQNPQSENPARGFVYSANNQPGSGSDTLYPGYYVPEDRARRIVSLLAADKKWSAADMQTVITDDLSPVKPLIVGEILKTIAGDPVTDKSPAHAAAIRSLQDWNGAHGLEDSAPVIYYRLIYSIMENAMVDELGSEDFEAFMSTHLMKRTTAVLLRNDASRWWDDTRTPNHRETRTAIFAGSFDQTVTDLLEQFGPDLSAWKWGDVHTLEHPHLLGRQKPLDRLFSVGPFPVPGGNEVINNLGFKLNRDGIYPVRFGPAMRILIDFSDVENAISVNPTGQSGNVMSRHYDDQCELFNNGRFRKQMMNREEIERTSHRRLRLIPSAG